MHKLNNLITNALIQEVYKLIEWERNRNIYFYTSIKSFYQVDPVLLDSPKSSVYIIVFKHIK